MKMLSILVLMMFASSAFCQNKTDFLLLDKYGYKLTQGEVQQQLALKSDLSVAANALRELSNDPSVSLKLQEISKKINGQVYLSIKPVRVNPTTNLVFIYVLPQSSYNEAFQNKKILFDKIPQAAMANIGWFDAKKSNVQEWKHNILRTNAFLTIK